MESAARFSESPSATVRSENIEARMKIEIREIGIPPRPSILAQIEAEVEKDEPDFINLAKIISQDVGLSASLIKVANSPYFSFGKSVPTVQEAMLVLGLKLVVNTVAGLALQEVFKHVPNMEQFWVTSATHAQVAGWVTRRIGLKCGVRPEDAYTFALFRDCGVPILLIPFPEYQLTLTAANGERGVSFTDVEDQAMGINHAQVGAELAENWLLPKDICMAIKHHHNRQAFDAAAGVVSERSKLLIAFSHVAEYLVAQQAGQPQNVEWDKLGEACLACLDIDSENLAVLTDDYMAKFAAG